MEARASIEGPSTALDGALVERAAATALLAGALDAAQEGSGSVVVLEGGHGTGRSALVELACALARDRKVELLTAVGRETEGDVPLGVALQLFEPRMLAAAAAERERLMAGTASAAKPLFAAGPPVAMTEPGAAVVHGLFRLAANMAASVPLALVVDDADLADQPSLRYLLYLAGRVEGLPIVLVISTGSAAHRGGEGDHIMRGILAGPAARRVGAEPLSAEGTASWLRASFFPDAHNELCAAVHEVTRGNPALIHEVGRRLAEEGLDPAAEAARRVRRGLPVAEVAEVARRRARVVGAAALDLMEAAALLGPDANVRRGAGLAGLDLGHAAKLSDRLATAGLLSGGDRLTFVHPVVEASVLHTRPAGERAAAHHEAARLLADDGAEAERVAGHLLSATRGGSAWVVDALCAGASSALARADADLAVLMLRRALEEPPSAASRARVLLELGRAEAVAGEPGAMTRVAEAIERIPAADGRARSALDTGHALVALSRHDDAAAVFELGLRESEEDQSELGGMLSAAQFTVLMLRTEPTHAVPGTAEPSSPRAEGPADRALLAQQSLEAALRGEPCDGVRELATVALDRGGLLEDCTADGVAYYLAVAALVLAGDLPAADDALTAAVEQARERGSALGLATASHFRGVASMRRGRVASAAADAETAIAGERYGWRLTLSAAHTLLSETMLQTGDLPAARHQLELAARHADLDSAGRISHLAARARLHLIAGRPDDGLTAFLDCGERLAALEAANPAVLAWRSGAARAMAELGDAGGARRMAEEELALARAFRSPGPIGRALRTVASLEPPRRAVEPLEEAMAQLATSHEALERAGALVDLGAALRRARRPRDAREPLRLGLDLAERCGSTVLAARAKGEATAAGARPRRSALHGLEALTPRELQAARLAGEGHSNREIARELYVTVKTVEWHLKHAYGKLGISSRRELPRALSRPPARG